MRFMIILKANKDSEAGVMPSQEDLAAMGRYNDELANAGVMLAGEGLHPSSKGKRLVFSSKGTKVIDGPFAETKELIAGFWLIETRSMDEAVEWVKRAPLTGVEGSSYEGEAVVEIRQVFEADDFGPEFTPELREQEARLREQVASRQ
jgi:hypothetical protein